MQRDIWMFPIDREIMDTNQDSEFECLEYQYWSTVYELISKGETEKAIQTCEQEPYSHVVQCQEFLGWSYYKKDELEVSRKWFVEAKQKGSSEAIFGIASIDFKNKQFEKALSGFKLAADSGYGRSCHWVGNMYRHGLGVGVDNQVAMNWYKRGADSGYLIAERSLIYLKCKNGNIIVKLMMFQKYILILLKALCIARKNINDMRLIDIRNAFENYLKKT